MMLGLPNISFSDLASQIYEYFRSCQFGTVDIVCLRKRAGELQMESQVRPPTERSFDQHTSYIPYEIALRTRIPVVQEILKLLGACSVFTLNSGSKIRVVDTSESLNSAAHDSAAIIREDASLVIWSVYVDSLEDKYKTISSDLRRLADHWHLEREKSEAAPRVSTMDDLFSFGDLGEYPDQCSPDNINWDSLVSLPEPHHTYLVRYDAPIATGGDASMAYYPWPLEYSSLPSPHHDSPDRELSPLTGSPSSWTTPCLSSDTLTSHGSPETANLSDISPPPHIIAVEEAPSPQLPCYKPAGFDFDDFCAAQAYESSPSLSSRLHPSAPASALASPSSSPAPTTQSGVESRYLSLMADVVPTTTSGSSYRSRLRSSSIMLATSDVLPSISRSSRERQARVNVSNRATPYPTNKRKPAPAAKSATTRAPRRATKAGLQHPAPSRKRARDDDDDDSELTDADADDSDDEYRDRPVAKKAKRTPAKVKNNKQARAFGNRAKRRRTKSYDLSPKSGRKFACLYQSRGCNSKCTRIGDTARHMVFSCDFRENKEFKTSESLCLVCGVHQARADALKRHIRDRHEIDDGKFPPGHVEALIATGKTEDFLAKYESIHKDGTAELHRVTELLNRKYRRSGTVSSDEELVSLLRPAVDIGLPVVGSGVEGDGGDTDDSSDEDEY